MTKTTIYLAEITKAVDCGTEVTVEKEAFDSMEKAEAFMVSFDMKVTDFGWWEKPTNPDYEGYITTLEVK